MYFREFIIFHKGKDTRIPPNLNVGFPGRMWVWPLRGGRSSSKGERSSMDVFFDPKKKIPMKKRKWFWGKNVIENANQTILTLLAQNVTGSVFSHSSEKARIGRGKGFWKGVKMVTLYNQYALYFPASTIFSVMPAIFGETSSTRALWGPFCLAWWYGQPNKILGFMDCWADIFQSCFQSSGKYFWVQTVLPSEHWNN